jgi:hypothetical protein
MRLTWSVLLAVSLLACDDGTPQPEALDAVVLVDASAQTADAQPDGAVVDATLGMDAGLVDAGLPDAELGDAALADAEAPDAMPVDERPQWRVCETAGNPTDDTEDWRHLTTRAVVLGDAGHSAQDVLAPDDRATVIPGKFAYGLISKDLEDEDVQVYLADCAGGWRLMGRATTDDDGRIGWSMGEAALPPIGQYDVALRVVGDDSVARSRLFVTPPGTHLMVFDIDGTLTTDDMELFQDLMAELFEPILGGDYVPEAREGGLELTQLRRFDQGRLLVYLTGRPYMLTDISRGWLADLGFPVGPLHVVDAVREIVPTNGLVGDYKADYLRSLQALGYEIDAAYGNAGTDIYAFAEAGVPLDRSFIAGPNGGEGGTVAVGEYWRAHLVEAAEEVLPEQTFVDP